MAIRQDLMNKFTSMKDEKELNVFLSEVITFLHDINEQQISDLVELQVYSKEKAVSRVKALDDLLKQSLETIKDNIKLIQLAKKASEINTIIAERDKLKASISRAQSLIDEAKLEAEKAQKATMNITKKKLQIARDRIVTAAETSYILGEQIISDGDIPTMVDTVNNIISNIGLVSDEMQLLGLWDEEDLKPKSQPIVYIKDNQEEKKATKTKRSIKKSPKSLDDSKTLLSNIEENQSEQRDATLFEIENKPDPLFDQTDEKSTL